MGVWAKVEKMGHQRKAHLRHRMDSSWENELAMINIWCRLVSMTICVCVKNCVHQPYVWSKPRSLSGRVNRSTRETMTKTKRTVNDRARRHVWTWSWSNIDTWTHARTHTNSIWSNSKKKKELILTNTNKWSISYSWSSHSIYSSHGWGINTFIHQSFLYV